MKSEQLTYNGLPMYTLVEVEDLALMRAGNTGTSADAYVVLRKVPDGFEVLYTSSSLSDAHGKWLAAVHAKNPVNVAVKPLPAPVGWQGTEKVNNSTLVRRLGSHIPDFYKKVTCPAGDCIKRCSLYDLVQHLNDLHKWTRESIADWLETLDLDLTVHQDPVREPKARPKATGGPISGVSVEGGWIDEAAESQILAESLAQTTPEDLMKVQAPSLTPEEIQAMVKEMNKIFSPAMKQIQEAVKTLGDSFSKAMEDPDFKAAIEAIKTNTEKKEQS